MLELTKAIGLDPRRAAYYRKRAVARQRLGDYADALADELNQSFSEALDSAQRATAQAPDLLWIKANLAHALLFSGRADEAKQIYLANRGKLLRENTLWEAQIHKDFDIFRKAGLETLVAPSMRDVDAELSVKAP